MPKLDIYQGLPDHNLNLILPAIFADGILSGGGNSVTLTFGTYVMTIIGSGLTVSGASLTAGSITTINVVDGAMPLALLNYQGMNQGVGNINNALDVFSGSPSEDQALDALGLILYVADDTQVNGSNEIDELFGSSTYFTELRGNDGDDILHAGAAGAFMVGGAGEDTITGSTGDDFVDGGAGNDILDGGAGNGYDNVEYRSATSGIIVTKDSRLSGTVTGNDSVGTDTFTNFEIVVGSNFADVFNGSIERDDFTGNGGADIFNGGEGRDRVVYEKEKNAPGGSAANGVAVNLSDVAVTVNNAQVGGFGTTGSISLAAHTARDSFGAIDQLNSIEAIRGTIAADFLVGSSGDDDFESDGGNDIIRAGLGSDFIIAGKGNDVIDGGGTSDAQGYDVLANFDAESGVIVAKTSRGAGSVSGGNLGTDNFTNIELVAGSQFNDTFNGSTGNDDFTGMDGADIFNGGAGIDKVDYSFEEGSSGVVVNLGATSFEGLTPGKAQDTYGKLDTLNAIENITGTFHDDRIIGSAVANVLEGGDGRDVLSGGAGNDTLRGGNGSDALVGGQGNDLIDGGSDDDYLDYSSDGGTLGVTVNLATGVAKDSFGTTDTLISIEEVVGTSKADTLTGGNNGYFGLRGLDGADTFNISPNGNQDVWVYYGQDAFFGGDERVIINLSASAIANAGSNNGTGIALGAGKAKDGFGAIDTLNNIHKIRGTALNDWILGSETREHFQMQKGADYIDGAGGFDLVDYSHDIDESDLVIGSGVKVNLSDGAQVLGGQSVAAHTAIDSFGDVDTILRVEAVRGTDWNDFIVGDDGDNDIEARGGDDVVLAGGGGFDFITGGTGSDYIDGQSGYDMIGFDGNNVEDNLTIVLDGASGSGSVMGTKDGGTVTTTFNNVERIRGSNGADTFTASGAFTNTNDAHEANSNRGFEVVGNAGDDTFTDTTNPAGGFGSLIVNYDEEKFNHDNFDGNWNGTPNSEIGVKINLSATEQEGVASGTATDTFGNVDTIVGVRQFFMTDTADKFWGRNDGTNVFIDARAGDDTVTTFGGNDIVWGGEGNDIISTGDGDDNVDGWDGNDTISTGAGDDWIGAGYGVDTIDGGAGRDGLGYDGSSTGDVYAGIDVALNAANGSGTISGAVSFRGGNGELHAGSVNGTTFANLEEIAGSNADDSFTAGGAFTNTADAGRVVFDADGGTRGAQKAFFVTGNKGNDVFTDNTDPSARGDSGGTLIVSYRNEQFSRDHDGFWGDGTDEHGVIVNLSGTAVDTTGFDFKGATGPASIAAHTAYDTYGNIDTLNNIQMIDLSNAADRLYADDNRDTFANGFAGNDTLVGGGGDDTFTGGAGNDTMSGGNGRDALVYAYEQGSEGANQAGVYVNLSSTQKTFNAVGGDVVVQNGTAQDLFGNTDTISGFEIVAGTGLADYIVANDSGMLLMGLGGADHLTGGGGDDTLRGGSGNDVIDGAGGSDWLDYGAEYSQRDATDPVANGVSVNLATGTATDTFGNTDTISNMENVSGTAGNDTIVGNSVANIIVSGGGNDTLTGGGGADTFVYTTGNVTVTDFATGDILDLGRVPAGIPNFAALLSYVNVGNTTDAVFNFGSGNVLTLTGVNWNTLAETDFVLNALPVISTSATFVTAENIANAVADINATDANGNTLAYSITGGADAAKFTIDSATGVVSFIAAPDFENPTDADADNGYQLVVSVDDGVGGITTQNVTISVSNVTGITYNGTAANNVINGATTPAATSEEDTLNGNAGNDSLSGLGGNDILNGGAGADTLIGGDGDDLLDGGTEADNMTGGNGNDTYIVNLATDVVTEIANQGTDTIITSLATYSLAGAAGRLHVENLTFTGTTGNIGTGNDRDNIITGNIGADQLSGGIGNDTLIGGAGNDILTGGAGVDTLVGGADNDTYVVDADDTIVEDINAGIDTVQSALTYSLAALGNVENLTLTGVAAINGTGNGLDNVLIGNAAANTLTGAAGNDTLNGGVGVDTMIGGEGDDTYVVDNAGDVVVEALNEGTDTIQTALAVYSLNTAARENVENLTLTAAAATLNGTGNALNNVLTALGAGNLTLTGLAGDDTYVIGGTGTKTIVEAVAGGTDTVLSGVTHALGTNVENLTLTGSLAINGTGNVDNNTITGNAAANILNGGLGDDTLVGGNGADTYVIDSLADLVDETTSSDAAIDTVQSTIAVDLSDALRFKGNIENVTLLAAAGAANVTGNSLANVILGNASANIIDGGAGGDTMRGGAGNDTYIVDDANDIIDEAANAGAGTDTVISSVTFSLANLTRAIGVIENLELSGSANIDATGNAVVNELVGNSGNNILNGGAGGDTMRGRAGDDVYVVDNLLDRVDERDLADADAGGVDTVNSSVSFDLASAQVLGGEVENVTLTGIAALNAYGNASANILTGNAAANILDGRGGADTMIGGDGADTYFVNDAGDAVIETNAAVAGGVDTVRSSIASYTLGANLENLILEAGSAAVNGTGNERNNVLTGNAWSNILNGGAGNDTMSGLAGNDTYIVDSISDVVIEQANQGVDTVITSVNFTLGLNVENLTVAAGASANGTGNAVANILIGNELNNTLRGLAGNDRLDAGSGGTDTLIGGAGNDLYVVNHSGVTINEVADGGSGIDTVLSSGDFDLTPNISATIVGAVENLILTGTGNTNGFGNALDNVLTGNSGNNTLSGNAGDDTISGGAGNDIITGGLGHDMLFGGSGADRFDFNAVDFFGNMADHSDDIFDYSGFGGNNDVIDVDGLVGDLFTVTSDVGKVLLAQRVGSDILIQVNEAAVDTSNANAPADWSNAFYIHDIAVGSENTIRFSINEHDWTLNTGTLAFEIVV